MNAANAAMAEAAVQMGELQRLAMCGLDCAVENFVANEVIVQDVDGACGRAHDDTYSPGVKGYVVIKLSRPALSYPCHHYVRAAVLAHRPHYALQARAFYGQKAAQR